MRVTCDKCKAVYAVDDKLIGPKGARAQCPKCKTLQIVRKDAPEAPAPLPPMPAAPAARPAPGKASPVDDLLGMVAAAPPAPAPRPVAQPKNDGFEILGGPAMPAQPDPFGGFSDGEPLGLLGMGAPASAGAAPSQAKPAAPAPYDPFGAAAAAPADGAFDLFGSPRPPPGSPGVASDPFTLTPPAPSQPAGSLDLFSNEPRTNPAAKAAFQLLPMAPAAAPKPFAPARPAAGAPGSFDNLFGSPPSAPSPGGLDGPALAAAVPSCRTCKKPLPDPFDAALGVCESCRNAREPKPVPATPQGFDFASASADPGDPFAGAASAPIAAPADPAPQAAPARSAGDSRPPAAAAASAAAFAAARAARMGSAARPAAPSGSGSGKWLALFALLVVVGAGGYVWFAKPAFLFKKPVKRNLVAIESRLMDWQMATVGLQGGADNYEKGRAAFLADKPTSYLEAEELFKAATVHDPTNLKAAAAYVEAFAVGRGERAPEAGMADARELVSAIVSAAPTLSVAHRARASLLLAADQSEDARKSAEKALEVARPEEQAEALLTLGCTYLKKSAPIALEKINAALAKDASLKRAYLYRGLANEYAGRYAGALADFAERLKRDPDQREALASQARVYAKLGDFKSARAALGTFASKHPNVGQPRILLVQLAYAVERDLPLAEKTLKELKNDEPRFDDQDKLELHTLWAAVARERGDLKTSAAQAEEALKIDPKWAPAHFQRMLTHLAAGEVEGARAQLRMCETKLDDPIRAKEYVGRIEALAGNLEAAISAFREASDRAPGRMIPRLNVGALLARKGELDLSWSSMRKALDADPTSVARQRRQVSDFFEAPLESVRGLDKAFEAIKDDVNWLPATYAAVAHYHAGEVDKAAFELDRVLKSDPTSLGALIYRAQIELDRKRFDAALKFAQKAVKAERQSAVTYYVQGRAEEGLGKPDLARQSYFKALERDPGLGPANERLGVLSMSDDKEGAKKALLLALTTDPDNLEARVALFKLGY